MRLPSVVRLYLPTRVPAACLTGLVLATAVADVSSALACGYHNPQAITVGTLNLVFPKALYVRTAVWRAEDSGPRRLGAQHGPARSGAPLQSRPETRLEDAVHLW